MPSLTDIPQNILTDKNPKAIIDWLSPIVVPLHVKRTLFRLWAHNTHHDCNIKDFTLIRLGYKDNR